MKRPRCSLWKRPQVQAAWTWSSVFPETSPARSALQTQKIYSARQSEQVQASEAVRKVFCFWWKRRCQMKIKANKEESGSKRRRSATAAGKYAARKPCLIASNLNFTSPEKSHRDSLQVMTNCVASCVVTPYIPNTLSPARRTHPAHRHWMPDNSSARRSQTYFLETGCFNCPPPVERTAGRRGEETWVRAGPSSLPRCWRASR